MRNTLHLYFFVMVTFLGSCKVLKNSANKNNQPSNSITRAPVNTEFLDNISVTPGSRKIVTSTSSDSKKTYGPAAGTKSTELENASQVQLKYASILNVNAEDLTNAKLLLDIDYWWGTKYCFGGLGEDCIDCSAFTQNLMHEVYNIDLPRTAKEQFDNSDHIKKNELREGDLVFFQTSRHGISHVGVYVANNKFVHASVSNGVTISDLDDEYWKKRYRAAGRVLK